jgi:hypothetical protein
MQLASTPEPITADLERLVVRIEENEESIAVELHDLRSDLKCWAMSLRRNPPSVQRRFLSLVHHHEENMVWAAEALRDIRWRLLGLQARTDVEGDAPVFDDPDALDRYLETR